MCPSVEFIGTAYLSKNVDTIIEFYYRYLMKKFLTVYSFDSSSAILFLRFVENQDWLEMRITS